MKSRCMGSPSRSLVKLRPELLRACLPLKIKFSINSSVHSCGGKMRRSRWRTREKSLVVRALQTSDDSRHAVGGDFHQQKVWTCPAASQRLYDASIGGRLRKTKLAFSQFAKTRVFRPSSISSRWKLSGVGQDGRKLVQGWNSYLQCVVKTPPGWKLGVDTRPGVGLVRRKLVRGSRPTKSAFNAHQHTSR